MTAPDTSSTLDHAFLSVWRQALVEQKKIVTAGSSTFSVRRTAKHRLAQIDFELDGVEYRGLEQNPQTRSRWAKMAREGRKGHAVFAGRPIRRRGRRWSLKTLQLHGKGLAFRLHF
jgi:hypothetical protein